MSSSQENIQASPASSSMGHSPATLGHSSSATQGPRFRPYASPNHHVTKGRYITSNDPRGYIPVYEYPLNGQWIMMDIDDGYILWTGIWKALGNSKADIVKMIDSQPDLAPVIRRVRGGYLKIQGTWMPYEVALRLSRRVAWPIRDDLIPLFGPTFPSTCLSPDQPGYGQVVASGPGRRRVRRSAAAVADGKVNWATINTPGQDSRVHDNPNISRYGYNPPPQRTVPSPTTFSRPRTLPSPTFRPRYAPYPPESHSSNRARHSSFPESSMRPESSLRVESSSSFRPEDIVLAPIQNSQSSRRGSLSDSLSQYALPPISAMEELRGVHGTDNSPAAVLRRLRESDDEPDRSREEERIPFQDEDRSSWDLKRSRSFSTPDTK
ncbi:transcription regulator HTH, apses-type DNA-binding domain-containing protein [Mycena floridula]|nr:transcription regulator HTH, apses-type DNA-binding domain-containing protein [Mycena floridula]